MDVRVITLRYAEGIQGFPEDALRRACAGREVLDVSEHYFVHGGIPHLSLVVKMTSASAVGGAVWKDRMPAPDLEVGLTDGQKQLFRALKKWRNERAQQDGKPAYAIGRNTLILEIVKAHPTTLAELKEVDGMGEASVSNYGKEILEIVANAPVEEVKSEIPTSDKQEVASA